MSDITTIETVEAEDYTVRVAKSSDGAMWEAVVLDKDTGSSGTTTHPFFTPTLSTMKVSSGSSNDDQPIGEPVTAPHRWVAIGFAIESYEWGQANEETVDVAEGYEMVDLNEISITFEDGLEMIDDD